MVVSHKQQKMSQLYARIQLRKLSLGDLDGRNAAGHITKYGISLIGWLLSRDYFGSRWLADRCHMNTLALTDWLTVVTWLLWLSLIGWSSLTRDYFWICSIKHYRFVIYRSINKAKIKLQNLQYFNFWRKKFKFSCNCIYGTVDYKLNSKDNVINKFQRRVITILDSDLVTTAHVSNQSA